jgi:hypothetical protein
MNLKYGFPIDFHIAKCVPEKTYSRKAGFANGKPNA